MPHFGEFQGQAQQNAPAPPVITAVKTVTADYTVVAADAGALIQVNTGPNPGPQTITLTLPNALNTTSPTFYVFVQNTGGGTLQTVNAVTISIVRVSSGNGVLICGTGGLSNVWAVSGFVSPRIDGVAFTALAGNGVGGGYPERDLGIVATARISASVNGDLVLLPQGNGATQAQASTGTVIGGNTRGLYALDLQRVRLAAAQVASGDNASILTGTSNTASGRFSVAGGTQSLAIADHSQALGLGSRSAIYGADTRASGYTVNPGDAQSIRLTLRGQSAGNTPFTLTANNGVATSNNTLSLRGVSAAAFSGRVIAKGTDFSAWEIRGIVNRDAAGSATTSIVGTVTLIGASGGAATWAVSLAANTVTGAVEIICVGQTGANISWFCELTAALAEL